MRRALALVQFVVLVASSVPVRAQAPDPELAQGVRQVREGDFEGAVKTLEAVVQRLAPIPERSGDLVQAYVQLGVAYVALDQRETARSRFKQALARDANLKLSSAEYSPKVLGVFEEARREAAPAGGGGKGTRIGLIVAGAGAAAAGVVLATRGGGGSDTPTFTSARFAATVVECPNNSDNLPIPVAILVEAQAGDASLTIAASATLVIVSSSNSGEIGFGSNQATSVTPTSIASKATATLTVGTTLLCGNGPGDAGRFNEWLGRVTLTTSAGVFTVETADRLRVNIP